MKFVRDSRASRLFVFLTTAAVLLLPLVGCWAATGGLPVGFGAFPAKFVAPPPGFDPAYFVGFAAFGVAIVVFLAFPRWFGFRRPALTDQARSKSRFPWWFWTSAVGIPVFWFLMWAPIPFLYSIERYAFVPLDWSMIAFLDGWVFRRNGGRSLMATKNKTFKRMILVSCLSWLVFEYLNFFVLSNWYYPNSGLFTNFENVVWFFLGYSTVLTGILEWYSLLRTVPALVRRYSDGPGVRLSRRQLIVLLIIGLALSFGMGFSPYPLFWAIWVSLVPTLGTALVLAGKTTPLHSLRHGDWSKVNLVALAALANGIVWELWNYGSQAFHPGVPTTPGFWKYSVPYVDTLHFFSEMPLLGYLGYLFFGVNCWILWNQASYLLGFRDDFEDLFEGIPQVPAVSDTSRR